MITEKEVLIPYHAHLLFTEKQELPAHEAYRSVMSNPEYYIKATRRYNSDTILLHRNKCECSACLKTFPVGTVPYSEEAREKTISDFFVWALQTPIAGVHTGSRFYFRPDRQTMRIVSCPFCGRSGRCSGRAYHYSLHTDSFTVTVKQKVEFKQREFALPAKIQHIQNLNFPLETVLSFDSRTGRTLFQVYDRLGRKIKDFDVVEYINDFDAMNDRRDFQMWRHISRFTNLKLTLIEVFAEKTGAFPFSAGETSLETFILLNKFRGYPREFYHSIPFDVYELEDEMDYYGILLPAEYRQVPDFYQKINLPQKKAIRRVIFQNPALLLYADEIKALPFRNHDIILSILKFGNVFMLLSMLRQLRNLNSFLHDLAKARGDTAAWRFIKDNLNILPCLEGYYFMLPEQQRNEFLRGKIRPLDWSIIKTPVKQEYAIKIPNDNIGEYSFVQLKTLSDYSEAAKQLHNCLEGYINQRVFVIKKGKACIAAVHLQGDRIVQARLKHNVGINKNNEIFSAFTRWIKKYDLKYLD